MSIQIPSSDSCNLFAPVCPDKFGCTAGVCPDFVIKRHDTFPSFRVNVENCDGPINLEGLILEASMWATAKLKKDIAETDTYFQLANDVGFEQSLVGDVIIMDRVRDPEHMVITGYDETLKYIQVQRGYNGTSPSSWKKGQKMRIFRVLNGNATTETLTGDVIGEDGTVTHDVVQYSYLVYNWNPQDTCVPGCYYLEFKLLKMQAPKYFTPGGHWVGNKHLETDGFYHTGTILTDSSVVLSYDPPTGNYLLPTNVPWNDPTHLWTDGFFYTGTSHDDGSVYLDTNSIAADPLTSYNEHGLVRALEVSQIPSFSEISEIPSDYGCTLGLGVEWVRRFPVSGEGFVIQVIDSPTREF